MRIIQGIFGPATRGMGRQLVAGCAAVWLVGNGPVLANSLDQIVPNWREANLRASLEPGDTRQVDQGGSFALRIRADQDASVLIVVVNPEGNAELLRPRRPDTTDRVSRGTDLLFPDKGAGVTLYAIMPVGRAYVYVLASPDPLLSDSSSADWVAEARIGQKLAGASASKIAVQRLEIDVKPPAVDQFISKEDFVAFYDPHGLRTRGVCHASRGLAVQFATNSAELTDWGKKQLNEVAAGMQDKRLQGISFAVEGHTDDVGTDSYNMGLSDRRAKRVWTFLTDRGVEDKRLKTEAKGKSDPAVPGTSEQARAQNRRVVIRRLEVSPGCKEAGL
jgi:outer membrane protein OmpA-like peptidoglycan-associated protein